MEHEPLVKLETIQFGKRFKCPWNNKEFKLAFLTPSAAWVEMEETREFEARDKKTGGFKIVKQKRVFNEPWSRGSMVEPI